MTASDSAPATPSSLDKLIAEAKASGGSEKANYQIFVIGLTEALGLERPVMAAEETRLNDYVFERRVDFNHDDGTTSRGFIDCYRRNAFVLEAKQSAKRKPKASEDQLALLPDEPAQRSLGHATRGTRGWDKVMVAARAQAAQYARALPVDHGYPPFLLVMDVGHVIEVYADFSGQGKNYAHFPDRRSYRISMDDLREPEIQERLRAIWLDPLSLDPAKKSAEVTRDIAERLARIARRLEKRHDPKLVAEFLMRCLFTMFAEDVGLIPDHGFEKLMEQMVSTPQHLVPALESLWTVMDEGGYAPHLNATLKRFNGALFKTRTALPLEPEEINELAVAAKRDWRDVEPAIFGTLLERALDSRERSKLGAHYTPRAYVERLVVPTIIEPLRQDWEQLQVRVQDLLKAGDQREALRLVRKFHRGLCTVRVLDPACGTGNFLYVSLELMKRLEGEVLDAIAELGGRPDRYSDYPAEAGRDLVGRKLARSGGEFSVDPHQFHGLEINPRAVAIADLVLWIGYLKWQLKTGGDITEPVLDAYGTIRHQDAVLAYDEKVLVRDETGKPVTRWDGHTKKAHPITGEEIPDPDARIELYDYTHPRRAEWPEAEFIVGNPPFIGGKDMRSELGDGYAEAVWKARQEVGGGADFVMQFWDEAACRLARKGTAKAPNPLRRFGFITTNSITQTFSRRVIERHLSAKEPISLVFAVPDHPWLKASDKAAVRIAMTVAQKGEHEGVLAEVVKEEGLNTDTPRVELTKRDGKITSKIRAGVNYSRLHPLRSNSDIGVKGFELGTQSLLISKDFAYKLLNSDSINQNYIFEYMNGNDLKNGRIWRMVIDTYPHSWDTISNSELLSNYLLTNVRPSRNPNADSYVLDKWWQFRRTGAAIRDSVRDIDRYIATTRTSKHRFFIFAEKTVRSESKIVIIALNKSEFSGILSSRICIEFSNNTGGRQGVGNDPVYQHTDTFDPFPFPACVTDDSNPALRQRLADLGERLDAFRKERLAAHDFLTMTGLYNVLERVRELENGCDVEPLSDKERAIYDAGLIAILKEIHDDIDRAAFEAYGWEDLTPCLVGKPGATTPSPHKSADQEEAEEELLSRLVALNVERQQEEARGLVRWLRPDYQIPKLGHKVAKPEDGEQIAAELAVAETADKPKWPSEAFDQIRLVTQALGRARGPTQPAEIASAFKGGRNRATRVAEILDYMAETGFARVDREAGEARYFLPR